MLWLPDRHCEMFKLRNVDTKCLYYDIGVMKCLLRSVCYKMCELRLWWHPFRGGSIFHLYENQKLNSLKKENETDV